MGEPRPWVPPTRHRVSVDRATCQIDAETTVADVDEQADESSTEWMGVGDVVT
jgi:hypothetical protein